VAFGSPEEGAPAMRMDSARAVFFTDLDGTLLDSESYEPSREAVAMVADMAARGIATVPVTSKTAAEVRRLEAVVTIAPVAVVEGGAVLLIPEGGPVLLGPPRSRLLAVLDALRRAGHAVRGLSEMDVEEVAERTALTVEAVQRVMERLASEPFVFLEEPSASELDRLRSLTESSGISLARGDRFWHLAGAEVDKGRGVQAVLDRYPHLTALPAGAVGDAWNDLPMLCRVAHRYLLGSIVADRELTCRVERIPEPGPAGFVEACRRFLAALGWS